MMIMHLSRDVGPRPSITKMMITKMTIIVFTMMYMQVSTKEFVPTTCEVKKGFFEGMIYETSVPLPWYGERCKVKDGFFQVFIKRCAYRYCCSEPCTCTSKNAKQENRCGANATKISCYELTRRNNFTMYKCCDGYQEIDHTCVEKINCDRNNGNCSDVCRMNVEGNYSYCDCQPGRKPIDFFKCTGPPPDRDMHPVIANAAVGAAFLLLFLILLALLILFLLCRRRRRRNAAAAATKEQKEGAVNVGYEKSSVPDLIIAKIPPSESLKVKLDDDIILAGKKLAKDLDDGGYDEVGDGVNKRGKSRVRVENDYSDAPGGRRSNETGVVWSGNSKQESKDKVYVQGNDKVNIQGTDKPNVQANDKANIQGTDKANVQGNRQVKRTNQNLYVEAPGTTIKTEADDKKESEEVGKMVDNEEDEHAYASINDYSLDDEK